jgi:hypothetical protein
MDKKENTMDKLPYSPFTVKSLVSDGTFVNVSDIAEKQGFEHQVMVSSALAKVLNPTGFLSELGLSFTDRIANVLSVLQGSMRPSDEITEVLPKGYGFDFSVTQGPILKEKLVSIKAEQRTDNATGKTYVILTLIPEADRDEESY